MAMKKKVVKRYDYDGLGFPVTIENVDMLQIDGEWHPRIDVKEIAKLAIKKLASQTERLTGNQVKFIRSYFSMSLRAFAEIVVNKSHTAVDKWEKLENKPTNMDINIEKIIRLYVHEKVNIEEKDDFYENYKNLESISLAEKSSSKHLKIEATSPSCGNHTQGSSSWIVK